MRTLYTVSYPEVSPEALQFMETFRNEHDRPYRDVVAPHFTMIFACEAIPDDQYTKHVEAIARESRAISFSCKYAMLGADGSDDTAYVFLVPDEGYAAVSLLHDRLYTGALQTFLRLDIPYIPHITIGTMKDRKMAKALCAQLNRKSVRIDGHLRHLTVGALQDGKLYNLSSHPLAA